MARSTVIVCDVEITCGHVHRGPRRRIDHNTAPKGRRPFAITGNGSLRCFAHFGNPDVLLFRREDRDSCQQVLCRLEKPLADMSKKVDARQDEAILVAHTNQFDLAVELTLLLKHKRLDDRVLDLANRQTE